MKHLFFIQALLSAALFGAATPLSKTLLADLQANQLAGLLYLGAAVCLAPVVVRRRLAGEVVFPRDRRNRLNLLGAVLFGGVVGPVLLLLALQSARAASVSMWLNLETVATAVLAAAIFREHLGRWTWVGNAGVVLAASIALIFLERHEHRHEHRPIVHEHLHRHDEHHRHEHAEQVTGPHSHRHAHEHLVHSHPHWPDLHHRHHGRPGGAQPKESQP